MGYKTGGGVAALELVCFIPGLAADREWYGSALESPVNGLSSEKPSVFPGAVVDSLRGLIQFRAE